MKVTLFVSQTDTLASQTCSGNDPAVYFSSFVFIFFIVGARRVLVNISFALLANSPRRRWDVCAFVKPDPEPWQTFDIAGAMTYSFMANRNERYTLFGSVRTCVPRETSNRLGVLALGPRNVMQPSNSFSTSHPRHRQQPLPPQFTHPGPPEVCENERDACS